MTRAVFPGTFDPIHYGHIDIARRAVRFVDELIVAVYDKPPKNVVFTAEERKVLAEETFKDNPRIVVRIFSGLIVEFCKEVNSELIVRGLRVFSDFEHEFRMALTNHRLAPNIDVVAFITSEEHSFLTGSTVKEVASLGGDVSGFVPAHVEKAIILRFKELGEDGPNVVPMTSLRD
jgi:pantetheine-phosphate adenylyltransferase